MILHKTPTTIIYIHTYYWEKNIKAVVHALYWNCIDGKCSIKKEYHYFYVWTLKKMINKIPKTSTNGLFFFIEFFSSRPVSNIPRSRVGGQMSWGLHTFGCQMIWGHLCWGSNVLESMCQDLRNVAWYSRLEFFNSSF